MGDQIRFLNIVQREYFIITLDGHGHHLTFYGFNDTLPFTAVLHRDAQYQADFIADETLVVCGSEQWSFKTW